MQQLNVALVVVGVTVLVLGIFSIPIRKRPLSMPLVALLVGVFVGPEGLNWLNPSELSDPKRVLEEVARLTLALGIMGAALRMPSGFALRHWPGLTVLLFVGMPLMWLATTFLFWGMLDVSLWVALLIGAVVCPTDPVLAGSIVSGKFAEEHISGDLRHTLSAESAANDGLAYPFVLLPIFLLTPSDLKDWWEWLSKAVFWEVGLAALFGSVMGLIGARLLTWAEEHHSMEEHSFLSFTLALTFLVLGGGRLLGCDGLLAVFFAGVVLQQKVNTHDRHQEERIQETVGQLFSLPAFMFFGLMLPWNEWSQLGWLAWTIPACVLLLRRLPGVALIGRWVPEFKNTREAALAGWFGPIGIAAIFYATYAERHTHQPLTWIIGSLMVMSSVIAHGVTATPLSKQLSNEPGGGSVG